MENQPTTKYMYFITSYPCSIILHLFGLLIYLASWLQNLPGDDEKLTKRLAATVHPWEQQHHLPPSGGGWGWSRTGCKPCSGTACRCWSWACRRLCPSGRWFCTRRTVGCWAWARSVARSTGTWARCDPGRRRGTSRVCRPPRPPAGSCGPRGRRGPAPPEVQRAGGCRGRRVGPRSRGRSGRLSLDLSPTQAV